MTMNLCGMNLPGLLCWSKHLFSWVSFSIYFFSKQQGRGRALWYFHNPWRRCQDLIGCRDNKGRSEGPVIWAGPSVRLWKAHAEAIFLPQAPMTPRGVDGAGCSSGRLLAVLPSIQILFGCPAPHWPPRGSPRTISPFLHSRGSPFKGTPAPHPPLCSMSWNRYTVVAWPLKVFFLSYLQPLWLALLWSCDPTWANASYPRTLRGTMQERWDGSVQTDNRAGCELTSADNHFHHQNGERLPENEDNEESKVESCKGTDFWR